MPQPAVSNPYIEIEQQLNGLLFVRGKRGVPTDLGSLFERHAGTIQGELRYLENDPNAWLSDILGHVPGSAIDLRGRELPDRRLGARLERCPQWPN